MTATNRPLERIVICGGGLAGALTTAVLAHQLPPSLQIVWIETRATDADVFYGNLTAPTAYTFNLSADVSEPDLLSSTNTTFAWGTQFEAWGTARRSWVQCFHLPLPIVGGVLFHHYLTRFGIEELEPFLISAIAARRGVFAHPLQEGPPLLARAEYAYQFEPKSYVSAFVATPHMRRVERIQGDLADVELAGDAIVSLRLADGRSQSGDLFIDCTGPQARLLSRLGATLRGQRRLRALSSQRPAERLGPACRTIVAHDFGWQSTASLQRASSQLTVYAPEMESDALAAHGASPELTAEVMLGCRSDAWVGNCLGIGQALRVVEPLTHAPMLLLHRDIERLVSLVPLTTDMTVERREFNRQADEDYVHAEIFNRALFESLSFPDTPYWRAARAEPPHEKLANKLAQFARRGILVAFDLEPFNAEDWTILHFGMGRRPAGYDRVAERAPSTELRQQLAKMRQDIENLVRQMPSHHDYMTRLLDFLAHSNG